MQLSKLFIAATTLTLSTTTDWAADDWQSQAIAPVANPIFFESPLIQSEVRPLFAHHNFDKKLLGADVEARVYAVQLRYAVNDRLAIIATKDGYMEIDPKPKGPNSDGWNDLAAGVKYALYKNDEKQIIVTPGLTFELPTGDDEVFQGNGDGEFNLFVSAVKGFDKLHVTGNVGLRLPIDGDEENTSLRYCAMVDYYTCQWFIPFVSLNAFHTLSDGKGLGIDSEGFDVVNFGSSKASGAFQAAWGVGFRSRLHKNFDVGFAYENGFTPSDDIFGDRFTVDLIWRF